MLLRTLVSLGLVAGLMSAGMNCSAASNRETSAKLRQSLVDALKDPSSAQFRREFLSEADDDKGTLSLCGEINSKNGYGGYVGFGRFVSTSTGVIVLEADERGGIFPSVWETWCSRPLKR